MGPPAQIWRACRAGLLLLCLAILPGAQAETAGVCMRANTTLYFPFLVGRGSCKTCLHVLLGSPSLFVETMSRNIVFQVGLQLG